MINIVGELKVSWIQEYKLEGDTSDDKAFRRTVDKFSKIDTFQCIIRVLTDDC